MGDLLDRDLISNLPQSIIESILTRLPIRDAIRTSCLSTKWRYKWTTLTHLAFDEKCVTLSNDRTLVERSLIDFITRALFLHQGPVHKFQLSTSYLQSCPDIDQWILFLSRNDIKELVLELGEGEWFRVPSCLFYCKKLTRLDLFRCELDPPPAFKGFLCLKSLNLHQVLVAPDAIESLISSCPLLESLALSYFDSLALNIRAPNLKYLCLEGEFKDICLENTPLLVAISVAMYMTDDIAEHFEQSSNCNFIKFLGGIPRLERLVGHIYFTKYLSIGNDRGILPITYNHLKIIELYQVSFEDMKEILVVLRLITNSPNLQELQISVKKMVVHSVRWLVKDLDQNMRHVCRDESGERQQEGTAEGGEVQAVDKQPTQKDRRVEEEEMHLVKEQPSPAPVVQCRPVHAWREEESVGQQDGMEKEKFQVVVKQPSQPPVEGGKTGNALEEEEAGGQQEGMGEEEVQVFEEKPSQSPKSPVERCRIRHAWREEEAGAQKQGMVEEEEVQVVDEQPPQPPVEQCRIGHEWRDREAGAQQEGMVEEEVVLVVEEQPSQPPVERCKIGHAWRGEEAGGQKEGNGDEEEVQGAEEQRSSSHPAQSTVERRSIGHALREVEGGQQEGWKEEEEVVVVEKPLPSSQSGGDEEEVVVVEKPSQSSQFRHTTVDLVTVVQHLDGLVERITHFEQTMEERDRVQHPEFQRIRSDLLNLSSRLGFTTHPREPGIHHPLSSLRPKTFKF